MPASLQHTLDFLRDLDANNNREWFNQNRARYDKAYAAFEDLVVELIQRFDVVDDLGSVTPSQCIYRIHRDVRFSPDKTPYKTWFGALLGKEGRKSTGRSYYIQVNPFGESIVAGGLFMTPREDLEKVRRAIAKDSRPLRNILDAASFKRYFGTVTGAQLKTAPKGYAKDHPDVDLLRYKDFLAEHHLTDEQLLSDNLVDYILEVCQALKPFVTYFYGVLE